MNAVRKLVEQLKTFSTHKPLRTTALQGKENEDKLLAKISPMSILLSFDQGPWNQPKGPGKNEDKMLQTLCGILPCVLFMWLPSHLPHYKAKALSPHIWWCYMTLPELCGTYFFLPPFCSFFQFRKAAKVSSFSQKFFICDNDNWKTYIHKIKWGRFINQKA